MQTYRQFLSEAARHIADKVVDKGQVYLTPGDVYYTNAEGQVDREDGPAIIRTTGVKIWFLKNRVHREGGPAIEFPEGDLQWWQNGRLHRLDGPAVVLKDGKKSWYLDDHAVTLALEIPDEKKWLLIRGNPENIQVIKNPTRTMQAYVIRRRPDLIGKIDNLDPDLKAKYWHEEELGHADL